MCVDFGSLRMQCSAQMCERASARAARLLENFGHLPRRQEPRSHMKMSSPVVAPSRLFAQNPEKSRSPPVNRRESASVRAHSHTPVLWTFLTKTYPSGPPRESPPQDLPSYLFPPRGGADRQPTYLPAVPRGPVRPRNLPTYLPCQCVTADV